MKRLICCIDGTWNNDLDEAGATNVLKISRAVLKQDQNGIPQVARYIRGIASAQQQKYKFLRGAVGMEVSGRIAEGYRFLQENYEAGDEIYLFGFSRGAFIVRSLASLIALVGMGRPGSAFSYEEAWRLYKQGAGRSDAAELARVRAQCHFPAAIACLGVWDTVGNIGNPILERSFIDRRLAFHDMCLHGNVAVALHALSLDEIRGPFSPTLFARELGSPLNLAQRVEQTWFAGTHADVGGGWPTTELSDIALLWMAERVQGLSGLRLDMEKLQSEARANPLGIQHASATGKIFGASNWLPFIRLVRQKRRAIPLLRRALIMNWRSSWLGQRRLSMNENVHESVLARFGQRVRENVAGTEREIVYAPRNLVKALGGEGRNPNLDASRPSQA